MIDRNRLIAAREAKGLRKGELARLAGHYPSYISDLENGNRQPSPEALEKLAEILEVDPTDLLIGAEGPIVTTIGERPSPVATVPEAATYLRCSTASVYAMVKTGRLPALRYGKRTLRIPWRALEEFVEAPTAVVG